MVADILWIYIYIVIILIQIHTYYMLVVVFNLTFNNRRRHDIAINIEAPNSTLRSSPNYSPYLYVNAEDN